MNISIILGHPRKGSFNHAIAERTRETLEGMGHDVRFHDLHAEGFDPILAPGEAQAGSHLDPRVERHCREMAEADGIVVIHPNWWGQPPALMKGWIDRVFRAGVAFRFCEGDTGEGVPQGLLKARGALVFNTTDTPAGREMAVFGDPLDTIWRNCIFRYCGVENVQRKVFGVVVTSTLEERQEWLVEVETQVREMFTQA